MIEKFTQEQLDKETDAAIFQLRRAQVKNELKFAAILVLVFITVFILTYIVASVPAVVTSLMGV